MYIYVYVHVCIYIYIYMTYNEWYIPIMQTIEKLALCETHESDLQIDTTSNSVYQQTQWKDHTATRVALPVALCFRNVRNWNRLNASSKVRTLPWGGSWDLSDKATFWNMIGYNLTLVPYFLRILIRHTPLRCGPNGVLCSICDLLDNKNAEYAEAAISSFQESVNPISGG